MLIPFFLSFLITFHFYSALGRSRANLTVQSNPIDSLRYFMHAFTYLYTCMYNYDNISFIVVS